MREGLAQAGEVGLAETRGDFAALQHGFRRRARSGCGAPVRVPRRSRGQVIGIFSMKRSFCASGSG